MKMMARQLLLRSPRCLTVAVLSLILPLSFLLLAKLFVADLSPSFNPQQTYSSFIVSVLRDTGIPIAHILLITLLAFFQILTQHRFELPLYQSWILLCSLQACVGFGIEATAAFEVPRTRPTDGVFLRLLFFTGLYEATVFWMAVAVRPVVDDTFDGDSGDAGVARWPSDHAVGGLAFGAFCWWRLREDLDLLGSAVKMKRQLLMEVEMSDILCLVVYYVTIVVGLARLVSWIARFSISCRRRPEKIILSSPASEDIV